MQSSERREARHHPWNRSLGHVWAVVLLALAMQTTALAQPRDAADRWKPQVQIASFKAFMARYVKETLRDSATEADLKPDAYEILVMDDLNEDSNLDFIVLHNSIGFCGSGGCSMEVFLSTGNGQYKEVADLFGHSSPRVRPTKTNGMKDVVAHYYAVGGVPVWSVYRWNGKQYDRANYRFCGGVHLEYCDAADAQIIEPVPDGRLQVNDHAPMYVAPALTASKAEDEGNASSTIIGKVRGKDWYLVEIWKGTAAFVSASSVSRSR